MSARFRIQFLLAALVLLLCVAVRAADKTAQPAPLSPADLAFFENKIRPILADNCYRCHSAESGENKGSLTLDTRAGWIKGGDSGSAVIVAGNLEKSLLIKAVSYEDASIQMPPGNKLSAAEIAALKQWVKMGAPDPRDGTSKKLTGMTAGARAHWAYQPVKSPPVPVVEHKLLVANPVDAFIVAKLESSGLMAKMETVGLAKKIAPREVLLRRATYDLTGLPPTPQELSAFERDQSPEAFEKVIDRLLASPRYGERWGRYWLDTARYADSSGLDDRTKDHRYVYAWGYRDYVIDAFNRDLPYDQFLREQIAADLLPTAKKNPESLAALGFLTVGKRYSNPHDTIDERIDTVTKATLGLTVACARCHDHKFDPIPTADYYSLHGIFASIKEPDSDEEKPVIGKAESAAQVADYKRKREAIEQRNREIYFDYVYELNSDFDQKAAGYILSSLYSGGRYNDPIKRTKAVEEFNLYTGSNEQRLNMARVTREGSPVFTPLMWFAALGEQSFQSQAGEVLRRIASGNDGSVKLNPYVVKSFKNVPANSLKNIHDVAMVYGKLFAALNAKSNNKTRSYIDLHRAAESSTYIQFDASIAELASIPLAPEPAQAVSTSRLKAMLDHLFLGEGSYSKFLFADLNDLELMHPGAPLRAMVVVDKPNAQDSRIFKRGDAGKPDKVVPRQFLEVLAGADRKPFKKGSGRLELAMAIADKSNPLTARVMVNRIWMHHFGEGFVHMTDNLGVQPKDPGKSKTAGEVPGSDGPIHRELLDYLARRFMDEKWSVKKMHKLIMLSRTYQRSSETNKECAKMDPGNALFWRANLRRLDFEAIRDSLIQFTGLLDSEVGGRPVNITEEPYSYRRSVYGFVDRANLPDLLTQFDYSDPNRTNSARSSSIVPPQALFLMNSALSADVARKVCSRPEVVNAPNVKARVNAIYRVIFQRPPYDTDIKAATAFANGHIGLPAPKEHEVEPVVWKKKSFDPTEMKGGSDDRGISNQGKMVDRRPLNIWEEYTQALLMTNELVYVQ